MLSFLAPSIFLIIFRTSIHNLNYQESLYSEWWFLIFLILYCAFVFVASQRNAQAWMYYIGFVIGFVIEVLSLAGIGLSVLRQATLPNATNYLLTHGAVWRNGTLIPPNDHLGNFALFDLVPLGLIAIGAGISLGSAFIVSPLSFLYILRSGIQFLVFLPTFVALFGAFSISNFSDFSWGNRDSTGSADKIGPRLETLVERGKFYGYFFLGLNFCLVFLSLDLFSVPYWRMIASGILFVPPLTSMVISCMYWIYWRIAKWCCRDGCRKVLSKKINLKSLSDEEKEPIRQIVKLLRSQDV